MEAMQQSSPASSHATEEGGGDTTLVIAEENKHILHVRDLLEDADEEEVAEYFEHHRRGGFKVEKVELLPESSSALVYFESPAAVEAVLQKGPFKINKKEVKVGPYSPATVEEPAEGAENRRILHVRDLHEDADEEEVADYFAHKRRGGFKVEKVELFPESSSALVYFESPAAVEAVLQKGPFKIRKKEVKVGLYSPATVEEPAEGAENRRILHVRDLHEDADEEEVADYFAHKRRGGFKVEKVELLPDSSSALVYFESPAALEAVLQKGPFKINKKEVKVGPYSPATEEEPPEGADFKGMLLVRGIPSNADEEHLTDFFESKRRGGYKVKEVNLFPKQCTAVVCFEEPKAINFIINKTWQMGSQNLDVSKCTPSGLIKLKQMEQCELEKQIQEKPQQEDSCFVLQVADLPKSASEETVKDFFESQETSGGCSVSKVDLDRTSRTALIYFEDPTAVETVLERAPFLINKKKVSVSVHAPAPAMASETKASLEAREEREKTCVVAVSDYGNIQRELLEMYFENRKRSGGDNIEEFKKDEKNRVVYVTFKSHEVAERVCEKTDHVLMGHDLKVSLHRAQPACPDRVFLTGLPVQVTRDSLKNFLVAWTKLTPKDIRFGEEEGTALIVFDSEIDMKSLKSALRENKLEDSTLEAQPVAASKSVLVKGKDPDITKDNLELFFDNTSKSGGEALQKVEKLGEGTWLVSFARHQVARLVSERSHCMRGIDLEVSLYMDCLGPEGGDPEPRSFPIPSPLSIPVSHPLLLRFLEHSLSQGKEFKELMALHHAQANLDEGTELTVTCTLTRETPRGKRLAKTWTGDVTTAVKDFLARFKIGDVRMSSTVFKEVVKELDGYQRNEDNVLVHNEEKSSTILVVGCRQNVDDEVKNIHTIKEKHEAEFERRRQTVDETITTLKPHELEYLSAIDFSQKAMENSPGLGVAVVCSKGEVKFKGLFEHVQPALEKMFELLQSLQPERIAISHSQESIIKTEKVQQYLRSQMQKNKLVVVWEVASRELKLWAATNEALVKATHIVKAAVQERTVPLDPESVALLSSTEWDIRKKVQGHDGVTIITEDKIQGNYTVTSLEESLSPAIEALQNFFKENTLYKQQLRFPPGRQGFLTKHLDIHELQNNNRAHHVRITPGEVFRVEGTKDGLARVKNELEALAASVKSKPHPEADKAFITFLKSPRGREAIVLAEKDTRCVIRETDDDTDKPTIVDVLSRPKITLAADGYQVIPGVKLFVTEDDITAMKVDAVVNAIIDNLQHDGGLARDISRKAVPSLQTEYDAYISQHGPLQEGEVWVSGAGSLHCQRIIHAVVPRYSGGQSGEEAKLKDAVRGSLRAADNLSLVSLAMPAISTGIFRYPVKEATQVMVEAIMEYFKSNPSSTLRKIHLVADRPEFVQHFHDAAAKLFTVIQTNQSAATQTTSMSQITKHLATGTDMSTASKTQDTPGFQVPVPVAVKGDAVTAAPLPSATGVGLQAVQGELATQEADVLVNTTSPRLQLTHGSVSKSLLAAGGDTLQQAIDQNYPHGLPSDQYFVMTTAGTLKAKKIFHTALPEWKNNGEKFLRGLLEKCVREADSLGFSSIAFPALGTGQLNYPRDVVARCFQDVASSLLPGCCSLQEIRVVLFPKDHESIKAFQSVMQTKDGSATVPKSGVCMCRPTDWKIPDRSALQDLVTVALQVLPFPVAPSPSTTGVGLRAVQGELATQQADVLVNPTRSDLKLNQGTVSKSLLVAGGDTLQQEIDQNYPNGLPSDQHFVITSAGRLKAKKIFHTALPDWKKNGEKFLRGLLEKCVRKADSLGFSSIAFPALGTGQLNYPRDVVARCFQDVASSLLPGCCSLQEIRVVLFPKDHESIKAFQSVMQTKDGSATVPKSGTRGDARTHAFVVGGMNITVKQGDILREKVDIIANGSNSSLDLDRVRKMQKSSMAMTSCKGLQCSYILHVDAVRCHADWKGAIFKCLKEAAKRKASIAFPALGTGNGGLDPEDAAKAFGEAFMQMDKDNLDVSLRDIRIVIFQEDMFLKFVTALQTQLNTRDPKKVGWMDALKAMVTDWIREITVQQPTTMDADIRDSIVNAAIALYFFSDDAKEIQKALAIIDEKFHSDHLERPFRSEVIKHLAPEQVKELKNLAQRHSVEVFMDQAKGEVIIKGLSANVHEATNDLLKITESEHRDATPKHWAPMNDKEVMTVTLSPSDPEYKKTEALFKKTIGPQKVDVVQIERVQNRTLYNQYMTKKRAMEKQHTSSNPVERRLWHGTKGPCTGDINKTGFNRSFVGENAACYGNGVYFAMYSCYSAQQKYSPPDDNGLRHMYLARVLTGDYTEGTQGMKTPPRKNDQSLYDSLVNNEQNIQMFVVFNDTQAYPEFLVTFK